MEATVRHIFPYDKKPTNHKFLIAVVLITVLIFTRCGNNGGGGNPVKYDTLELAMFYEHPLTRQLNYGYGVRWIVDSFTVSGKEIKRKIDTFYFTRRIDTLRNSDGTYKKDSLGRYFTNPPELQIHPPKLIRWKFLDSPPPYIGESMFPSQWLKRYGTRQDSINLKIIPNPDSLKANIPLK